MPKNILQAFVAELEGAVEELQQRLDTQFDFAEVERLLSEASRWVAQRVVGGDVG